VTRRANLSFKNKFPYISVTDKASDFKFDTHLGFPNAHHKIPPEEKWMWPWVGGAPKIWGSSLIFVQRLKLATSNLACSWGLRRPTIKPHPEEKSGRGLELWEANIWAPFYYIFAMAALSS